LGARQGNEEIDWKEIIPSERERAKTAGKGFIKIIAYALEFMIADLAIVKLVKIFKTTKSFVPFRMLAQHSDAFIKLDDLKAGRRYDELVEYVVALEGKSDNVMKAIIDVVIAENRANLTTMQIARLISKRLYNPSGLKKIRYAGNGIEYTVKSIDGFLDPIHAGQVISDDAVAAMEMIFKNDEVFIGITEGATPRFDGFVLKLDGSIVPVELKNLTRQLDDAIKIDINHGIQQLNTHLDNFEGTVLVKYQSQVPVTRQRFLDTFRDWFVRTDGYSLTQNVKIKLIDGTNEEVIEIVNGVIPNN
jgi:hypothetical protein